MKPVNGYEEACFKTASIAEKMIADMYRTGKIPTSNAANREIVDYAQRNLHKVRPEIEEIYGRALTNLGAVRQEFDLNITQKVTGKILPTATKRTPEQEAQAFFEEIMVAMEALIRADKENKPVSVMVNLCRNFEHLNKRLKTDIKFFFTPKQLDVVLNKLTITLKIIEKYAA